MKFRSFFLFFLSVTISFHTSLHALEITDRLNISGFGTVGFSTNNRDDILYDAYEGSSTVEKGEFNFQTNTIFGLQGKVNITDSLSFTAQGVSQDHEKDNWDTNLQWAYLQYDTALDLILRVGKFRLPIFQTTELAYVGYARTSANPILPFYGVSGFEFMEGVQALYREDFDNYALTFRLNYGRGDDALPKPNDPRVSAIEVETDDIVIASLKFEKEDFWLNAAYTQLSADIDTYIIDRVDVDTRYTKAKVYSVEYNYDYEKFNFMGGYAASFSTQLPDEYMFYHSIAYRIGDFKPYILYSTKYFRNLPPLKTIRPDIKPPRVDESKTRDKRWAIGCRYDFHQGFALKYQFERIDNNFSPPNVLNTSGDNGTNHVHTLVLDWMF